MYREKSLKASQQFNTPSKQMILIKKHQAVKTVSVFIQNIDAQLAQSYKKLKINKQKNLSRQKVTTAFAQTQKLTSAAKSINKISLKSNPLNEASKKKQLSMSYKRQTLQDKRQIVLMDNKQVMDYVNYVYSTYQIADPFEKYKNLQGQSPYQTNKKITETDEYGKQLYSAQTLKNTIRDLSVQSSPFNTAAKRTSQKNQDSQKKAFNVITLKTGNLSSREHVNPTSKLKNKNRKIKNQKGEDHSRHSSSIYQYTSIPQIYRYCFMCQLPILQCNLVAHEQICTQLKRAYQLSLCAIIQLLDSKINRLIKEINEHFVKKKQSQINEEINEIKESLRNWMQQLPPESITKFNQLNICNKQNHNSKYNPDWRQEFFKIQQNINKSVCRSFQLVHKLNWFAKLRQNIARQFYNKL